MHLFSVIHPPIHPLLPSTHLDVVEIGQPQERGGQHAPGGQPVVGDDVGEEEEGEEEHGGEGVGLGLFFGVDVCGVCFFWGGVRV